MSRLNRIVFFGGYRAKIFEWKGRKLLGVLEFEPTDDGYMHFFDYIAKGTSTPTALLLDIIEEDFQRDTIPKINIRDQSSVIDRRLDKHYRGNPYVNYEILGPSPLDAKKNEVILSSLINPEVFAPWLNIMKESGVALRGIYSVPYLSNELLSFLQLKEKNMLLVSRQVRSAFRETYFKKGHLYFSRFAKLPRRERIAEDAKTTNALVVQGTEHVHHFLRNQRIVTYNEPIHVYALVPENQIDDLPKDLVTDFRHVHYIGLDSIYKKKGLKKCEGQHADALFSYICSTQKVWKDHYATSRDKKEMWFQIYRKAAVITSNIAAVFFFCLAAIFLIDTVNKGKETRSLMASRQKLEYVYEQSYQPIERQISESSTLKKAVSLADYLVEESKYNLQNAFPVFGHIMEKPEYDRFHIIRMEWVKYTQEEFRSIVTASEVKLKKPENELQFEESYDQDEEEVTLISLVPVIKLNGVADRENMSYSETVLRIQEFVREIKADARVADVISVQLPVDPRVESRFEDQVGKALKSKSDTINENVFEFIVVLKGQQKTSWTNDEQ